MIDYSNYATRDTLQRPNCEVTLKDNVLKVLSIKIIDIEYYKDSHTILKSKKTCKMLITLDDEIRFIQYVSIF